MDIARAGAGAGVSAGGACGAGCDFSGAARRCVGRGAGLVGSERISIGCVGAALAAAPASPALSSLARDACVVALAWDCGTVASGAGGSGADGAAAGRRLGVASGGNDDITL